MVKVVAVCSLGFTAEDTSDSAFTIQNIEPTTTTTTTTTPTTTAPGPVLGFSFITSLMVLLPVLIYKRRRKNT